jgi:hypothetical protein
VKSTLSIIAALSLLAAAGCAGKVDQVAMHDEVTQIMTVSALKVAIADNAQSGNVYEYSSPVPTPAPQHDEVTQIMGAQSGNVPEYY